MHRLQNRVFVFILAFMLGTSGLTTSLPPIRILSIDGGGVRGLIPATVLMKLEADLDKPIAEIFDFIAGTSIGGIIALSLVTPDENGKPIHTAAEVVTFAFHNSWRIFNSSYYHWIGTLGGLLGPKYDSEGLQDVLEDLVGDTMMSDAIIPTVVTGYHLEGDSGIEFSSLDAQAFPHDKDCLMREVGLATAAAPTYFDSADVHYEWGELNCIADGALYQNNPALLAYANAKRMFPDREIEVFSIGTGVISAEEMSAQLKGRGLAQWASPILKHISIGNVDAEQTILHKVLNNSGKENYFRLNVHIENGHKEMDNTSETNLIYLYRQGLAAAESDTYHRMVARLRSDS